MKQFKQVISFGSNFRKKSKFNCVPLLSVFAMMFLALTFLGCSDDSSDSDLIGNWVELSDFEGVPRSDAVCFTIGDLAYVGTGYDGEDRLQDFWEYDPIRNNWSKKADFPGVPRNGAVGFGTSTKGYLGTGYDGTDRLKDFWEYDPATNTWTQIADFDGSARYGAVAFSLNDKGYVGTGDDSNFLKDFWEYDPASDTWTQKISIGGGKRRDAVAFVINNKGYVCTGVNNGVYEDDFWQYDANTDTWAKMRDIADNSDDSYDDDYAGIIGINKAAFVVNGKGYVAAGGAGSVGTIVWEYDSDTDLWEEKTALEASARTEAVGFGIDDMGYVTCGRSSSYYFDDLWGFRALEEQQDLDKAVVAP